MKRNHILNLLPIFLVVVMASTGCKHRPQHVTTIPGQGTTGPGNASQFPPDTGNRLNAENQVDPKTGNIPLVDPGDTSRFQDRSTFAAETVHFEFDRSTVRAGDRSKVERVASYLKANPNAEILVEGHCDERGTEGYNLSLGDRRALAVREALVNAGLAAGRVHTVSRGEAQPADPGHGEAAWAKNRRAEFILAR